MTTRPLTRYAPLVAIAAHVKPLLPGLLAIELGAYWWTGSMWLYLFVVPAAIATAAVLVAAPLHYSEAARRACTACSSRTPDESTGWAKAGELWGLLRAAHLAQGRTLPLVAAVLVLAGALTGGWTFRAVLLLLLAVLGAEGWLQLLHNQMRPYCRMCGNRPPLLKDQPKVNPT